VFADLCLFFRYRRATKCSYDSKDPEGAWTAPTGCYSIRENDFPVLYLLRGRNIAATGALRHCLSPCEAKVHELSHNLFPSCGGWLLSSTSVKAVAGLSPEKRDRIGVKPCEVQSHDCPSSSLEFPSYFEEIRSPFLDQGYLLSW
jgi:hypothetical protein